VRGGSCRGGKKGKVEAAGNQLEKRVLERDAGNWTCGLRLDQKSVKGITIQGCGKITRAKGGGAGRCKNKEAAKNVQTKTGPSAGGGTLGHTLQERGIKQE